MALRGLRISARSITGLIAGSKHVEEPTAWFESTLERDLLLVLEFAPVVIAYTVQPVRIAYTDETGRARTYTPDVLVQRRGARGERLPDLLCEVKYRAAAKPVEAEARHTLVRKLIAARRHARARGWRFVLLTEREIRGPYLQNARFLLTFRHHPQYPQDVERLARVARQVRDLGGIPAEMALATATTSPHRAAQSDHTHCITALWHLLATGVLLADYTTPLTMQTWVYDAVTAPIEHRGPDWLSGASLSALPESSRRGAVAVEAHR